MRSRSITQGWLRSNPHEVIPRSLEGVRTALSNLRLPLSFVRFSTRNCYHWIGQGRKQPRRLQIRAADGDHQHG
ncbi:hypothetical protein BO83DRAFT_132823 [Aspergillus eucalypticola CBS 122712]|uniref:Uncharacterized protein n=1 Tax=Aspergillus eucalypticola (strain CBS 122712 / IBT 29274) TaxID=1448314 RepID=A0A317W9F1_ASPEC|nr:uncharacterized protein BO83DRAFT_132823 [Aspergillus eucalypticola CBS 122712]PWY82545.1 hypothetical protein BO83DRAFT_132823 [Aspergillus eucalypticola CBS 122712]